MKNKKIKINMKCVPIEQWDEYWQFHLIMILLGAKTEEQMWHILYQEILKGETGNETFEEKMEVSRC